MIKSNTTRRATAVALLVTAMFAASPAQASWASSGFKIGVDLILLRPLGIVRTGFGATIERRRTCPMPNYLDFEIKSYEQMEALLNYMIFPM